jgi:hypothetical protein
LRNCPHQSRCFLDFTRFRRDISAASYRTFVTVGNWPEAIV